MSHIICVVFYDSICLTCIHWSVTGSLIFGYSRFRFRSTSGHQSLIDIQPPANFRSKIRILIHLKPICFFGIFNFDFKVVFGRQIFNNEQKPAFSSNLRTVGLNKFYICQGHQSIIKIGSRLNWTVWGQSGSS